MPEHWPEELTLWLWRSIALIGAIAIGYIAALIAVTIISRAAKRAPGDAGEIVVQYLRRPLLVIGPLIGIQLVMDSMRVDDAARIIIHRLFVLAMIAAVAWLLIQLVRAAQAIVQARFRMDVRDNLEARRVNTQVWVLQKTAIVLIIILAAGAMLMTFPQLRQVGTSMLASAGLAGLVVGFAARPVLSNLIAGVQLALTQPMRLDDVVIVEGEWGRIEEILSTYVVVRIWDERRLVVPLSYFVENSFQNWTRTRADLLGTAFVYVDYSVPVEEVRQELHRILEQSDLWDKRAWALQVTDLTEHTMQLRALMSAADAGSAFELRCFVRERLVEFIRNKYPDSLPRVRAEWLERANGSPNSSPNSTDKRMEMRS